MDDEAIESETVTADMAEEESSESSADDLPSTPVRRLALDILQSLIHRHIHILMYVDKTTARKADGMK